jgi:hypothetical protein
MSDVSEAALQRIAALEAEVSGYRRQAKPEPQFNMEAFRQDFIADPVGTMQRLGAPVDHVTRVLVANAMGEQAPPELKMLAAQGPQVNAARALEARVEALSRQLSDVTAASSKKATRESFQAITADKSKYPHLAKAVSADPSLVEDELGSHGGTAEELAAKLEARLSKVAAIYAPPAASSNAETQDQSTQVAPATTGGLSGGVPPLTQKPSGVFTPEDHARLRDECVRKATSSQP